MRFQVMGVYEWSGMNPLPPETWLLPTFLPGYNGAQLWDVAFAVQAILATNLPDEYGSMLKKANYFIKNTQIRKNSYGDLDYWYRHVMKGGWCFSTLDNGWPVSDCTAEGLKSALMLAQMPSHIAGEAIAAEQLYDAVDFILSLQNSNGGFASYELTRSYAWLEMINSAESFADIMIDYQYVECTSAVYTNLEGNKSHIVNTGWAMLALIEAGQEIIGVFNKNCMISCSAYRTIFPIWALGVYRNRVLLPTKLQKMYK
ncbi:cycloartenol synthase 2-like isoform X2 [Tripterygium wilfordii]|uniref:Cycloartenol synthase 2-like isoform X2 n=1 Tax=Tripterygium wilfordii TaxID=458696 RepID=A0A7J7CWP0_TRIWF|nr:cycloartenol synthase 2-like isoform X2 [Tripterygium wilfordii]